MAIMGNSAALLDWNAIFMGLSLGLIMRLV